MKKINVAFSFFFLLSQITLAQQNCLNALPVTICPNTILVNQTNLGMGDDSIGMVGITGEDVVYRIDVPSGAVRIYVHIDAITFPGAKFSISTSCPATSAQSYWISGMNNIYWNVPYSTTYYLFVDAPTTVNYNITIGGDTATAILNIPNTMGQMLFDTCSHQPFSSSKKFVEVSYNGSVQHNPMTLSPLGVTGTMCITTYIKNTTGVAGPKDFKFQFPTGFSNVVTPVQMTQPGLYRPGNWIATVSPSQLIYTFVDSAGLGYGDFNGPMSCAAYTFCFNVIPFSNDPTLTNIIVSINSDLNGRGYTGTAHYGCCPSCSSAGVYGLASGSSQGLSFGVNDPGFGGLPVELINFKSIVRGHDILLEWRTATEVNNDHFVIEKSEDGIEWKGQESIQGYGTSSTFHDYSYDDMNPLDGYNYYRLCQIDFDGKRKYYDPLIARFKKEKQLIVFPNPAKHVVYLTGLDEVKEIAIKNAYNETMRHLSIAQKSDLYTLDLDDLSPGIYMLMITMPDDDVIMKRIVVQ